MFVFFLLLCSFASACVKCTTKGYYNWRRAGQKGAAAGYTPQQQKSRSQRKKHAARQDKWNAARRKQAKNAKKRANGRRERAQTPGLNRRCDMCFYCRAAWERYQERCRHAYAQPPAIVPEDIDG
jgi:hypothetical protein